MHSLHSLVHQLREIADELEDLARVGGGSLPVSGEETWRNEDGPARVTDLTSPTTRKDGDDGESQSTCREAESKLTDLRKRLGLASSGVAQLPPLKKQA